MIGTKRTVPKVPKVRKRNNMDERVKLAIIIVIYLALGWKIILTAVRNIFHGDVFDENFLMVVASIGAICIGEPEEAVMVMLLYRIGEFLQDRAVGKSRKAISDLMNIRPDYANVEKDGQWIKVDPEEVAVGTLILVKPGERVPLDGVIIEGSSRLDTAALTGESLPSDVSEGSEVQSGTINLDDQSEAVSFSSVIGTIQYDIGKLNGTEEVSFSDLSVPLELDIKNPSAFFWHTDPKTHEEKCICISDAGLTADNAILQEPVQQLCCDYPEFGQFYAVSEYGADYTHGGKLSRLQDGAWVPVANSVNTYVPVEPDALYLINGAPVTELILKRGEQEYSIDTVTAVLHAAAPGSP